MTKATQDSSITKASKNSTAKSSVTGKKTKKSTQSEASLPKPPKAPKKAKKSAQSPQEPILAEQNSGSKPKEIPKISKLSSKKSKKPDSDELAKTDQFEQAVCSQAEVNQINASQSSLLAKQSSPATTAQATPPVLDKQVEDNSQLKQNAQSYNEDAQKLGFVPKKISKTSNQISKKPNLNQNHLPVPQTNSKLNFSNETKVKFRQQGFNQLNISNMMQNSKVIANSMQTSPQQTILSVQSNAQAASHSGSIPKNSNLSNKSPPTQLQEIILQLKNYIELPRVPQNRRSSRLVPQQIDVSETLQKCTDEKIQTASIEDLKDLQQLCRYFTSSKSLSTSKTKDCQIAKKIYFKCEKFINPQAPKIRNSLQNQVEPQVENQTLPKERMNKKFDRRDTLGVISEEQQDKEYSQEQQNVELIQKQSTPDFKSAPDFKQELSSQLFNQNLSQHDQNALQIQRVGVDQILRQQYDNSNEISTIEIKNFERRPNGKRSWTTKTLEIDNDLQVDIDQLAAYLVTCQKRL